MIQDSTAAVKLSFWQHRSVQDVLPIVTSLLVHVAIIVAGVVSVRVIHSINKPVVDQVIVPEASFENATVVPAFSGQDVIPSRITQSEIDIANATGTNLKQGKNLAATLGSMGGGSGNTTDGVIGIAHGGIGIGVGRSLGTGVGDNSGAGNNDGPIAPIGTTIGGGPPNIFSSGCRFQPNIRRIVYVLDATGSMMSSFDDLRRQVINSVQGLRPPTSFDIVFMNDRNTPALSPQLLFSTPENKRKAQEYVETMAPRGATDPVPALTAAYALQPDLIYFLIDPTDFPDRKAVADLVAKQGSKVKLNIIAFEGMADPDTTKFLKDIAAGSGGVYRFITAKEMQSD